MLQDGPWGLLEARKTRLQLWVQLRAVNLSADHQSEEKARGFIPRFPRLGALSKINLCGKKKSLCVTFTQHCIRHDTFHCDLGFSVCGFYPELSRGSMVWHPSSCC